MKSYVFIDGRICYLHAAILFVCVDKGDPDSWHKHFVDVRWQIACVYSIRRNVKYVSDKLLPVKRMNQNEIGSKSNTDFG